MSISPVLDTAYPALIFKADRGVIHHGALGIARSLGRLGVPVYAIVEDSCTPLATSRYLTKAFVWRSWPADRETLLEALSTIGQLIGHRTILVPIDDLSAVFIAENAAALRQWYLCPQVPRDLPRQLANKATFYSMCARIGIPIARSVVPQSLDDVREFIENATFPIVVKAAEQWRLINDRYNVKVIWTRQALLEFCKGIESEEPSQVILQEYITGKDWIYHGYCDCRANLYLSFTGKKLLDYPPGAGSTALGVSFRNEALRSQSEGFLRAISYSGIVDIDCREDVRDGQYKIMDCNPRIGMNFRMFENGAGIDVVRAQHLNLTGRSIECPEMIEGRQFLVESYYLLSTIRGGRRAFATESGRSLALRGKEFAWWSPDDKLPFLVMSVRLFLKTAGRALQYALRRLHRFPQGAIL